MSHQVAVEWSAARPPWPAWWRGLVAVGLARALIRFLPLPRVGVVLGRIGRWARPATAEEGEAAVALVRRVSMRAAAGRDPIPSSVAAALACLGRRTSAQWRVGLRSPPVEMHAWIEAGGRAVGERVDVVSAYPTIVASSRPVDG